MGVHQTQVVLLTDADAVRHQSASSMRWTATLRPVAHSTYAVSAYPTEAPR
jgi:hypothetical protein